ncbi:hypothetical protein B5F41_04795 [Gordonibacter sp. An232A]|nr:hypothetical protein B5F41_04795 [Gordonibacter sp. An232A]
MHCWSNSSLTPEVSIICMAYNHEKYIADALEGFLAQETSFPYEVIVHDDASLDDTADIIRSYAAKYGDVIRPILQSENQHSKGVRLAPLLSDAARGRYVALCEGDDYWISKDKLQRQYDCLERNPRCSASIHNAIVWDQEYQIAFLSEVDKGDCFKDASRIILEGGGRLNPSASIFCSKEQYCVYIAEGYRAPVGDHPLLMSLAAHGDLVWLCEPMSVYRLKANSSWTFRTQYQNVKSVESYCNGYVAFLRDFNERTGRVYSDAVEKRIAFQESHARDSVWMARYACGECSFLSLSKQCCATVAAKALIRKRFLRFKREIGRIELKGRTKREGTFFCDMLQGAPDLMKPLGRGRGEGK